MLTDAVRSLRRSRGVSLFIITLLALTIAAATVTFSVVDAVVLKALPFPKPGALVAIEHQRGDRVMSQARSLTPVEYSALRDRADAFASLAAVARDQHAFPGESESERVYAARVTASLFDVLQVRPLIGDTFTAASEVDGSERVAVIGHGLWSRRFGRDPAIVGRTIQLTSGPLRVIGVMPDGFTYPMVDERLAEIWTPLVVPPDQRAGQPNAGSSYLHLVGRLRDGASPQQAQSQVDAVRRTFAAADSQRYNPAGRFATRPLHDLVVGDVRGWMVLVLVAVGLVLLIACANVANILLTRAMQRARELSIRTSLGATRGRLMATLLAESILLSLGALAIALLLSWWGVEVARNSLPRGIARAHLIALNLRVFAAAFVATMCTSAIIGVIPAFHAARTDLVSVLKNGASGGTTSRSRWRHVVLVAEVAFTAILLVATTLFVSSFVRLTRADLGFDRSHLIVVSSLSGLQGSLGEFIDRLKAIPGVAAVGGVAAGSPPLVQAGFADGGMSATRLQLPDAPATEFVTTQFDRVSPDYLAAAGIPLRRGRLFTMSDMVPSAREYRNVNSIVLDEVAAARLFGTRDPVGQAVMYGGKRVTVIGVVANVRMRGPEADTGPQAYLPGSLLASNYSYIVQTTRPSALVVPDIRAAVASMRPPDSRAADVRLVEDAFRNITARRRFSATAMMMFGLFALLIGASGVYAVMSSLVAQRTREIGVRMALGATRGRMVGTILAQIGRHLALGLAVGLPAAWLVSRSFDVVFFEVRPSDLWIYAVVGCVLAAVGFAAALVPARRASLVDPLVALRTE